TDIFTPSLHDALPIFTRFYGGSRGKKERCFGDGGTCDRLGTFRLRSLRAHKKVLRAHGEPLATRSAEDDLPPRHCAGRQQAARDVTIRYGASGALAREVASASPAASRSNRHRAGELRR